MTTDIDGRDGWKAPATEKPTLRRGRLVRIIGGAVTLLRHAQRRRDVHYLARLGDHTLADIGLRREDLYGALSLDISRDPTDYLVERARSRRNGSHARDRVR